LNSDEAQTRIFALKEKAEKEQQAYLQEMKELDRILEQDRKLKEFMATKNSDRSGKGQDFRGSRKDNIAGTFRRQSGSEEMQVQVPLEEYEKAFSEIRKVTGIDDVQELVQQFIAIEDQNFSLFNYVNEINNEIELHTENITELEKSLNDKHAEAVKQEQERNAKVALLEVIMT
jgi:coiled-coil domain-containing protein 63/114